MDRKVVLNLSVSAENKQFAIGQYEASNGRYASVSHWANEILNGLRREKEKEECARK